MLGIRRELLTSDTWRNWGLETIERHELGAFAFQLSFDRAVGFKR